MNYSILINYIICLSIICFDFSINCLLFVHCIKGLLSCSVFSIFFKGFSGIRVLYIELIFGCKAPCMWALQSGEGWWVRLALLSVPSGCPGLALGPQIGIKVVASSKLVMPVKKVSNCVLGHKSPEMPSLSV